METIERFEIEGRHRLKGETTIHGAKNSVLPILAGCFLTNGVSVIKNCPKISDVDAAICILEHLSCKVHWEGNALVVDSKGAEYCDIPDCLMREMRSSIIFLGAVLSRFKRAKLSFPGGCEIGLRPIDIHLDSLKKLGVSIVERGGYIDCQVGKVTGKQLHFQIPSVGATENMMLFCAISEGTTTLTNVAKEPEIEDLQNMLCKMGAKISGAGTGVIQIEGVKELHAVEHTVIPDRIETASYLAFAAATGGDVVLKNANADHLGAVISALRESGCEITAQNSEIRLLSSGNIYPLRSIRTMPYPGFPTDAQAILMAYLTVSSGVSVFTETIFENRYRHVDELSKMGANIQVEGKTAIVRGVKELNGASVCATDLRGGAALILAGLAANGVTSIGNIHHIDRGYETPEKSLSALGAVIKRVEGPAALCY